MKLTIAFAAVLALAAAVTNSQTKSPGAGPVLVLETAKGNIEIETYPEEAPKTVAHILALVKRGFYNGLRFHRAEANFVIQIGDPMTRDMSRQDSWGRGNSGKPIGVAGDHEEAQAWSRRGRHGPRRTPPRTPTASSTSRSALRLRSTGSTQCGVR